MVSIYTATQEDCEFIAGLHIVSWQQNYNTVLSEGYLSEHIYQERKAIWKQRFESPKANQMVFVAKIDDEPVGFICLFGSNHNKHGSIIDNLHVLPNVKGKGVGKALLEQAAKWLLANYPDVGVYLEVLEVNQKAIAFYEYKGAHYIDRSVWHTPCDNDVDEFIYGWSTPKDFLASC